ncbi:MULTISPECIES: hypothetical protein [unclassified Ensifer]|uniref:hypothetical protein n=1 Tax=unclassified Ensifer TaxID=2633371 RepID=UPI000813D2DE|nr:MULTISPECIES: hypothetical protein [unclassified Ensifer]OCP21950.1 hypothetical protein BC361_25615 [Ensifer sp. LC54]OCP23270.1 hypothetical protein BC363_25150 [Ensifer sp. LC384]
MRTDEQIVMETNDLARHLLAEVIGTGYQVPEDHKFWKAEDPRSQKAWQHAVKIMEMTTKTEVEDALNNFLAENDNPIRRYRAPTGAMIIGTAETVPACALINGIAADGTPDFAGETKCYWDGQLTNRGAEGKPMFQCDDGQEWTFDQLTPIEEEVE